MVGPCLTVGATRSKTPTFPHLSPHPHTGGIGKRTHMNLQYFLICLIFLY
jgi:hypothetical protein